MLLTCVRADIQVQVCLAVFLLQVLPRSPVGSLPSPRAASSKGLLNWKPGHVDLPTIPPLSWFPSVSWWGGGGPI